MLSSTTGKSPVSNAESGPLAGLTLAVKDIFDVAGYPSGWGNPQRVAETGPAAKTARGRAGDA